MLAHYFTNVQVGSMDKFHRYKSLLQIERCARASGKMAIIRIDKRQYQATVYFPVLADAVAALEVVRVDIRAADAFAPALHIRAIYAQVVAHEKVVDDDARIRAIEQGRIELRICILYGTPIIVVGTGPCATCAAINFQLGIMVEKTPASKTLVLKPSLR